MSDSEELDVLVVGAGLAGLACAFEAARAGLQVAVLERGDVAGAKNLSGGRLYLEPVREVCKDLLAGAPFERTVVSDAIVLTDEKSSVSIRVDSPGEAGQSVTVLRAKLDAHLADQVGAAGAMVLPQQRAEGLIRDGDRVVGVKVGTDELRAKMVVAADGVLSFLAEAAGLRRERHLGNYAVGIKEIVQLTPQVIEERFNLGAGQGASRLYLGEITRGMPGGAFLYTNRDSLSLGLVLQLGALQQQKSDELVADLLETFKARPDVAPLLAGGKTVEYGAHLIPEGGAAHVPALGLPGLLLVGDAAGFVLNTGTALRGMDLALCSGALCGQALAEAKERGLDPVFCLERYREKLQGSFVMRELERHRHAPRVLANQRLYARYPRLTVRWALDLLAVNAAGESLPAGVAFRRLRKDVLGFRGLRDLWKLRRI